MYAIFEILIYGAWIYVVWSRWRRTSAAAFEELCLLGFALPTTIIMELRNEYLLAGVGTYYPHSLWYFTPFKFPVAIVVAGSLFAWAVYVVSRAAAARLGGSGPVRFNVLHLAFFLVLLTASRLVEVVSVGIGYWQWRVMPDPLTMWVGAYVYYLRFALPAAIAAKILSWYVGRMRRAEARGHDSAQGGLR